MTADILVDLIAQRSLQKERNRLTLSLNDAVERSAYLTANEFAELSLAFLLRYSKQAHINSFDALVTYLQDFTGKQVPDVSRSVSSYNYISAQSCGDFQQLSRAQLMKLLISKFGGVLSLGIEKERFSAVLGDKIDELQPYVIGPCINDQSKFQVLALNKEVLEDRLKVRGLEQLTGQLWDLHSEGLMTEQQFIEKAAAKYPGVKDLFEVWDGTSLGCLTLTSVGLAIGFSNLKRVAPVDADLGIWID